MADHGGQASALVRRAGVAPLSPAAEALVQAIRERTTALGLHAGDEGRYHIIYRTLSGA